MPTWTPNLKYAERPGASATAAVSTTRSATRRFIADRPAAGAAMTSRTSDSNSVDRASAGGACRRGRPGRPTPSAARPRAAAITGWPSRASLQRDRRPATGRRAERVVGAALEQRTTLFVLREGGRADDHVAVPADRSAWHAHGDEVRGRAFEHTVDGERDRPSRRRSRARSRARSVTWPRTISAASVTDLTKTHRRDDGRVRHADRRRNQHADRRDDSRHGTSVRVNLFPRMRVGQVSESCSRPARRRSATTD